MIRLIATAVAWLTRKLGLLLLILALLLVGAWLRNEWAELRSVRSQLEQQERVLSDVRAELASVDASIAADDAAWQAQIDRSTGPLREQIDSVRARLAQAEPSWQLALQRFADLEQQATAARKAARDAQASVARLEAELRWWDKFVSPAKVAALEAARAKVAVLQVNARAWEKARDQVAATLEQSPVAALRKRRAQLEQDLTAVARALSPRQAELRAARERRAQEAAAIETTLAQQRARLAQDPREQLIAAAWARLPLALAILAAVLLAPLLIKTVVYFALAPIAERLPPLRVLASTATAQGGGDVLSAVSVPIDVGPHDELLVHADFLQSSSSTAAKDTQWLLNNRVPFASLASGLFALTRIRPPQGQATQVVVASRQDAFGEVGIVDLPAGAAMVVLPRALAGVVHSVDAPVRITRHWQLARLQGWLTLRLRHLVFHGPCRLVLKGRRGVRAEQPQAAQPRIVNQASTLAFSANLDYQVTRCETFVSYLRGKDALFNDRFSGGPGRFIYEELPTDAAGRRIGRGLEGVIDAALKAFGI